MTNEQVLKQNYDDALNDAYIKAGHNAYFGNGFRAGYDFIKEKYDQVFIDLENLKSVIERATLGFGYYEEQMQNKGLFLDTLKMLQQSLEPKAKIKLIPLTGMSGDHFDKIFGMVGFAPSFKKEIINRFKSLHGFHDAIASYGNFESYRTAIELNYDVEFTLDR